MTVMSRQASLGSLSEDQVTISDQQLLEQCISSGMPKTKNVINPSAGTHTDLADEDAKVSMWGTEVLLIWWQVKATVDSLINHKRFHYDTGKLNFSINYVSSGWKKRIDKLLTHCTPQRLGPFHCTV